MSLAKNSGPRGRPSHLRHAGALTGMLLCLLPPAAWSQTAVVAAINRVKTQMAEALGGAFVAPAAPQVPALAPPPVGAAESLASVLARVLPRDPQVRVAQALADVTEQRRLQARSRLGPTALLTLNGGGSEETEFGRPISRSTGRSEAGLRWNLYNAGNDVAEINGATRDVIAAAQELRRAREEVADRLVETYTELLRLQTLLPHAQERLDAVRKLVEQLRQQNAAGKTSDADATQAAASLVDAEIVHEQLLSDLDSARQKLAAQVGGEVRAAMPVNLLAVAPLIAMDASNSSGLVSAAQARADAARDRVRPVASVWAPRIDLELRKQLGDRTTPQLTTQQRQSWQVTARWEIPVMGESSARRTEAQRRAEAAQAEAERVAQGAQSEGSTLAPRIANAERSLAQLDRQVTQYNALVRAGELQFEAGRRTVSQLIQLRDSRYNVEQRRSEQAQRLLSARLRLLSLQGRLLPALGLGS